MTRALPIALWTVLALGAGCGLPPPIATEQDALRAHVERSQLEAGRELLLRKCGSCHDVPVPNDRPAHAWPAEVARMAPKAGLDGAQRALIEQYLVVMAPQR